jgi:hypothetical protein
MLITVAVELSRRALEQPAQPSREVSDPARRVEMIYIPPAEPVHPPPPARPVLPPVKPMAPPPVLARKEPEPEPNAPPEAVRSAGSESDDPRPAEGERTGASPAPAETPREDVTATLESEARRIFGRPRVQTPPGAGPQATRPMEAYLPDHPERCTPEPVAPRESAAPPQFGTVVGRIFEQGTGHPLAGAQLQMLGAPYVAFTDGNGEYRFRFDLAMVDNCRTQYVRVTARGYETRLLVLVVGPNAESEDVRLRRR